VDFGEILDFLVTGQATESILLYIEGIRDARRYMSALRAAARVKPVVALKVGRYAAGSKAPPAIRAPSSAPMRCSTRH
jgi:acetyltransferase